MTGRSEKFLSDIKAAIDLIDDFLAPIEDFNEYVNDKKTQSAVERQLAIMGEAVNQYEKHNPEHSLTHAAQIISLRNRLIHAYDAVDNAIIWTIVKNHLAPLKQEVEEKL